MGALNYEYDKSVVALIRALWKPWKGKKEMSSYYKNLLFFRRRQS
jgi:hypothetical protein